MKEWQIWAGGYSATGGAGKATLLTKQKAESFLSAIEKWKTVAQSPQLINPDNLTYWGCRLFDNETEARKSFG